MAAAAVVGAEFDLRTLGDVVGQDTTSVLNQLEPAFAAGLLVAAGPSPGRCRFSHGLVRDTLYDDLGAAARPALHQRAAEALEANHGSADGPHLLAIAEHWFRAVPAGPAETAVDASLRASRWAQQNVAHQQAGELLQVALTLLAAVPEGRRRTAAGVRDPAPAEHAARVDVGLGVPAVAVACTRMRELCGSIDDITTLVPAMWRLAAFHAIGNDFESAVSVGDELLAIAADNDDPRPWLAGHMILGPAHTNQGDIAAGRPHLDRASELCHAGHDHLVDGLMAESPRVWTATMSAWNWVLLDDIERAERDLAHASRHAESIDSSNRPFARTYACWAATLVATLARDVEATRQRAEHGLAKAREDGGGAVFVPLLSVHLGWANALAGDFDSGATELVDATSALPATRTGSWRHVLSALLADAHLAHDRFAEALHFAEEGLQQSPSTARAGTNRSCTACAPKAWPASTLRIQLPASRSSSPSTPPDGTGHCCSSAAPRRHGHGCWRATSGASNRPAAQRYLPVAQTEASRHGSLPTPAPRGWCTRPLPTDGYLDALRPPLAKARRADRHGRLIGAPVRPRSGRRGGRRRRSWDRTHGVGWWS